MLVKYPQLSVCLIGADGNAFIILTRVRLALREHGCSDAEIASFTDEAMASDYDHLLQTVMRWVNVI